MLISKDIQIAGSEGRLMGTDIFCPGDQIKHPVVIYIHGFNGMKDWGNFDLIASQFAANGFVFIKMNLSHNGTTPESPLDFADLDAFGNNNYTRELFDTEQIIQWVLSTANPYSDEMDTGNIILLGHSRGGGVAIVKAFENRSVSALITWASVSACKTPWGTMSAEKMKKWAEEGVIYYENKRTHQKLPLFYQLYQDYLKNEERLNIEKAMKGLSIPVLICHGKQDPAVPFQSALDLHRWNAGSELYSVDSDHVFGRSHPWTLNELPAAMQNIVDESIHFLNSTLKVRPAD